MRVSPDEHDRFIRQENGQDFVNGDEQKFCSVSVKWRRGYEVCPSSLVYYSKKRFSRFPMISSVLLKLFGVIILIDLSSSCFSRSVIVKTGSPSFIFCFFEKMAFTI